MSLIGRLLSLFFSSQSPESLVKKANALAAKEDFSRAMELYRKAMAEDSYYVPAYDGLGKVYFRMGFRDEADREFNIADGLEKIDTDPDDADAMEKLGWALLDKGKHKMAASLLEPIIEKHPRRVGLLKIVALAYKSLGNTKKARELLRLGLERWPKDSDFYQHLGSLETKAGRKEEGEWLSKAALLMARAEADLMDSDTRYELGQLFCGQKKYNHAAEFLRQALNINRQNSEYWNFLGECYLEGGLHPAAVDAFKEALKVNPSEAKSYNMLAKLYRMMGRFNEARQAKELATVLEGGQSETKTPQQGAKFIKYLLSIGKNDDARDQLSELLGRWPESHDLMLIQGRLLFKDDKYQEAIETLKEVAAEKETWAEPHIWMAMAYQKLGDSMSALAEGQLATRLAPRSHAIHKLFGDILRDQKKFSMAENAYETAENLRIIKKREKGKGS